MPKLGSYRSLEAADEAIEDFKKRHSHLAEMSLVLHGVQVVDPSGKVVWDGVTQDRGPAPAAQAQTPGSAKRRSVARSPLSPLPGRPNEY